MIGDNELKKWIESVHCIFEIFEGRYDAYLLVKKWLDEWFYNQQFTVLEGDIERLNKLKNNFDYRAFGIEDSNMIDKINSHFTETLKSLIDKSGGNNIGTAIAPYLFTWNFQRVKQYYKKRRDFSLKNYFQDLGEFIKEEKEELKEFKGKKLLKEDINKTKIISIFDLINSKFKQLGINQNEPVGTAKLLHIVAPSYFPLIDNSIAEAIGLKNRNVSLTPSDYHRWMVHLKQWLQLRGEIIEEVEQKFDLSILKLVDEGFYVMSSIKLSLRLAILGVDLHDR